MSIRPRLPEVIVHDRLTAQDLGESTPWSVEQYGIPELWATSRGKGVKVGIVDTGVDDVHIESGDLVDAVQEMRDFTGSRHGPNDQNGHGTHVAGIIAAREGNGRGITGIAPDSELYIAKGLGDGGSGSDQSVADAIVWCVDHGCKLVNLSLGTDLQSTAILRAIQYALSKGCLVVAAAGNSGGRVNFPGRHKESICVGAVDERRVVASFSCRGPEVDVCFAGVEITSCYKDGGYAVLSGTSMATPGVVGVLALMLAVDAVSWELDAVRKELRDTAIDEGSPGFDYEYGAGLVNPAKLVVAPTPTGGDSPSLGGLFGFLSRVGVQIHAPAQAGDLVSIGIGEPS